jgi:thiol:disulfide interchange protein DsbC
MRFLLCFSIMLMLSGPAWGFMSEGCGAGSCRDCHSLEKSEAEKLLEDGVDKVVSVEFSEMPGVWRVEVEKAGNRFPLYLDFSKQYVVAGNIIRLKDKKNITLASADKERVEGQEKVAKVDIGRIPLDDALLLGDPMAERKAIVFTDPLCPYCERLHGEMHRAIKKDPNVAFYIKFFPLKMHPESYGLSKTLVCKKDIGLLDRVFAGDRPPQAECEEAAAIDANLLLVKELGIVSTPTLILPDGTLKPGSRSADDLLLLMGSKAASKE